MENRLHRDVQYHLIDHRNLTVGCVCDDDCSDRNKCSCWQSTLAGSKYTKTSLDRIGYQDKRLKSPIWTGIYECNFNCKCSTKCSNRVAQLPISHSFEVFMTKKCGWGIRCRNDLPQGTFICLYIGDLMTEEHTADIAQKHGDTYVAALDFIGSTVEYKEDYEPNVIEKAHKNSSMGLYQKGIGMYRIPRSRFNDEISLSAARRFFGSTPFRFSIDAKRYGNLARFMNVRFK